MTEKGLQNKITQLTGVGTKRADAFAKLGIFTLEDLLFHFPKSHENRKLTKKIIELSHDETICVRGVVTAPVKTNLIRKKLQIHTAKISDGTGFLELVWFNNPYIAQKLQKGCEFIFYGKVRLSPKKQMLTPIFESPEEQKQTGRIMPLYPLTEGLTQTIVSDAIGQALRQSAGQLIDPLPQALRQKYQLAELNYTIQNIHFPTDETAYDTARRRLAFEELFLFHLALFSLKNRQSVGTAPVLSASSDEFKSSLPFRLTGAQNRVIAEIEGDLKSGKAMNRLVCGDVGSGKTAVAAAAIYTSIKSGYQAAFMAPTEILAQQHFESLKNFFTPHGIRVELLLGSTPIKKRREALERLKSGESHLAVGTHALLSADVIFHNLALALTDEQHRFGVNQRKLLTEKGENCHVLVMSATPIPRTLALIIYGDLDISIINERPPGRQQINTYAVTESYRDRIYSFLKKELTQGHQAYIVCPLVEESEALELHAATKYAENLQKNIFPDYQIGLLHGKLKPAEKDAVMADFKDGKTRILVATTVIEVGVDVPNATIMMIENAERFGLSQLHQLRGRVGRGTALSHCILLSSINQATANARLETMKKEHDGFKIAEEDLKLRGPGEFFGTRQHGLPSFRMANLYTDMALLKETTDAARDYLSGKLAHTDAEEQRLTEKIKKLFDNHVTFS